ncbi:MAG TPA: peptidoglycan recognition family protein, partial [Longimicrobium sp.]|nr:peptidoglycan recognition family protein [Longimicrobium sp.]
YLRLEDDLRRFILATPREREAREVRWAIYDLVAEALSAGRVSLGGGGPDLDAERRRITTVVVHHSGTLADIPLARLSAMGLLRLYAPAYLAGPARGTAIRSHHWRDGRQVFFPYHWLVRPDGRMERLLEDGQVGWHAGDWEVNCASVGICFAGDYCERAPSAAAISSFRRLAARYAGARIIPHSAVNGRTDCPGAWFRHSRLD